VSGFVIDASVAIKWVVEEEGTPRALSLRCHSLSAPDLVMAECANILWKKVHRKELTADEAQICAGLLAHADIELLPMRSLTPHAMRLASRLDHSAYDCMYLAVSILTRRPFVTADLRLVRKMAAEREPGVEVIALETFAN
jgi:predicted nucleic acid-binding protein